MSLLDDFKNFLFKGDSGTSSSLGFDLGSNINKAGNLAAAYAAYDLPEKGIEKLEEAQRTLLPKIEQLGEDVAATATFKPFSVRTGTGATTIGQAGDVDVGVSSPLQALSAQLQGQAGTMAGQQVDPAFGQFGTSALGQAQAQLGQATPTAQSLFDQMQAMRQGETERARLQLENRLAAQGRLGTQTAAYGGTPESLALNKAIQEQQSADMLQAFQLAPQLAQQNLAQTQGLFSLGAQAAQLTPALQAAQLANIGTALGTSFAPEQQALAALGAGTNVANIVQAARQGQTEAQAQLGTAGIASEAELFQAIAGLESARAGALADALQGLFAAPPTTISIGKD